MFKKMFSLVAFSTAILLGFTACSEEDDPIAPTPNPTAKVMVIHASPDAPGVDLFVDNAVAGSNLTFPNNTGYLEVEAGTRNVKVNVTGTQTTVIAADLNIAANTAYSAF